MESRVNYTVVGIFVIVSFFALLIFGIWLGKYNQDERDFKYFYINIKESVSGLNHDATVKYNGVDVGKVDKIEINPDNSEAVLITIRVLKTTPVKIDSRAILKSHGITGLVYVEIVGGKKESMELTSHDNKPPTIKALPSLAKKVDDALQSLATKISESLDQTNKLLSDDNINSTSKTIKNLEILTAQISNYQDDIKRALEHAITLEQNATVTMISLRDSADSVKNTSENFNTLIKKELSPTLTAMQKVSKSSDELIEELRVSFERGDYDIDPAKQELQLLLEQSRYLLNSTQNMLHSLQDSPSDLIFKKTNPKLGPGE